MSSVGAGGFCTKCGTELDSRALFCPKCGHQVAPDPTTGTTSGTNVVRKSGRRLATVVVVVVIVAVVALSAYVYLTLPGGILNPARVRVNQVIWTSNGASLGTSPGFSVKVGSKPVAAILLSCSPGFFGPDTCASGSVYVLTGGFGVASTNAPFTWSSGGGGATAEVRVTLTIPASAYSGNLDIDLH